MTEARGQKLVEVLLVVANNTNDYYKKQNNGKCYPLEHQSTVFSFLLGHQCLPKLALFSQIRMASSGAYPSGVA
ncbi:hypothetical protein ACOSP7_017812 [Xanthoceras sorbifolium]